MPADARTRVLVAVAPRLLGDVLCRVLAREDLDVVVYTAEASSPLPAKAHFDVAVASTCLPGDVAVDIVIRLPDDFGNAGVGSLLTLRGEETAPMWQLDGLMQLFARICPHRGGPALEPLDG